MTLPPDDPGSGATLFRVLDAGTLLLDGMELPATRAEAYDLDPESLEDASDLVQAAEDCPPLGWHLDRERDDAGGPTDLTEWLESLTSRRLRPLIRSVRAWLREAPDWAQEDDYIPPTSTPQGAALEFFRDWGTDDLQALGIEIVEGECPGSTYYAARLRGDLHAANRAARDRRLPVGFLRSSP